MSLTRYIQNIIKIIRGKYSANPAAVFSILSVLEKNYPVNSPFRFILVGANDGVSHDLLYPFLRDRRCTGIAFEPDSRIYEQLVINYAPLKNVILINKAVHPVAKELTLYKVDPTKLAGLPAWAAGIGSLDAEHYKRSGTAATDMVEEKVQAGHLMDLLRENGVVGSVDLLQIDTEGFDLEVIKQVDFKTLQPAIVRFEYENLSETDTVFAIRLLKQNGYYCFYEDMDVVAIKTKQVKL